MIYQTIDTVSAFAARFKEYGRHNTFCWDSLQYLYGYFNEIELEYELDVISICHDFTEYNFEELVRDYGHLIGIEPGEDIEGLGQDKIVDDIGDFVTVHTVNDYTFLVQE